MNQIRSSVLEIIWTVDDQHRVAHCSDVASLGVDWRGYNIRDLPFEVQEEKDHWNKQYGVALKRKGNHSFAGHLTVGASRTFYINMYSWCGASVILFNCRVYHMPAEVGYWSHRKRQILYCMGLGMSEKEIAKSIGKSESLVRKKKGIMADDLGCYRTDLFYYGSVYVNAIGDSPESFTCPPDPAEYPAVVPYTP